MSNNEITPSHINYLSKGKKSVISKHCVKLCTVSCLSYFIAARWSVSKVDGSNYRSVDVDGMVSGGGSSSSTSCHNDICIRKECNNGKCVEFKCDVNSQNCVPLKKGSASEDKKEQNPTIFWFWPDTFSIGFWYDLFIDSSCEEYRFFVILLNSFIL